MARIIYGIQSDGMGHAIRSKPVIEHLISKGHKVKILTSGKALLFLKKDFHDVEEIEKLYYYYYNNKVSYFMTIIRNIIRFGSIMKKGLPRVYSAIDKFKPDLIITDFERFTSTAAVRRKLPLISIDNNSMLRFNRLPFSLSNAYSYFLSKLYVILVMDVADVYFLSTFFKAEIFRKYRKNEIYMVPPILRSNILSAKKKARYGRHILVYQTTDTNRKLIPALNACKGEQFIFYGCNEDAKHGNVTLRKFSEDGFIDDFASCKGVITNGGLTLICEAIYLGKPILSNPVGSQYEQDVNAEMVEKYGYGMKTGRINSKSIAKFLSGLEKYRKSLRNYHQDGNRKAFASLDRKISDYLIQNGQQKKGKGK